MRDDSGAVTPVLLQPESIHGGAISHDTDALAAPVCLGKPNLAQGMRKCQTRPDSHSKCKRRGFKVS